MSFNPRFANGIYRDCRFCQGRGCLACAGEADKAYRKEFPEGPKPLATFKIPEEMPLAKELIGADALTKHFSPEGKGMSGLIESLRAAGKLEE